MFDLKRLILWLEYLLCNKYTTFAQNMKKINYLVAIVVITTLFLQSCISTENSFTQVAPGIWRGVLTLEKPVFPVVPKDSISLIYDQFKPGELPFNFEVTYTSEDRFYIDIINGDERIRCDSIRFGRDKTTARDTFNIYFPEYASYIHAEVRGSVMQGYWTVTTKENYRIHFVADSGKNYRFTSLTQPPVINLTGKWATLFGVNEEKPEKAIGEFKQTGNRITGTFRTETGDYRFLEGTIQGRKFWLSCFDGAHAFLFSGVVKGDSLQGEFRSGKNPPTLWTAWIDPKFQLGNPDSLTQVVLSSPFGFDFNTPDGKKLRFPGPDFDQKIGVFTIMGTWCPNCRDEQVFLTEFLKNNPTLAQKMAVVGFSFERHKEPAQANAHLKTYREKMHIPYDLVYAGNASAAEAAKVFPSLDKVLAFPTMIIVDKKGKIRSVHTGFDGPATSQYSTFKQQFTDLMNTLALE